jgi:hypothetical protein
MSALLVSDQDREYTVGLLRSHWLTGRLRYSPDLWGALRWLPVDAPARRRTSGAPALILSGLACCIMFFTLGIGFPLALPLFIAGWAAGREARRSAPAGSSGVARAGEVLGIVGTLCCLMFVAGCAAILT